MKSKETSYSRKKKTLCIMGLIYAIFGILVNRFCSDFEIFFCFGLIVIAHAAIAFWGLWKLTQKEKKEKEQNSVSDFFPK